MADNIIKIEEEGNDLVINDQFSIPKAAIIIAKRDGFCTLTLPRRYYKETSKSLDDTLEVYWNVLQDPSTTDNDDLFNELVKMKR